MSATVETSASSTSSWRKRCLEEDAVTQIELKRPRYYYRLESESSKASEEDTESVYSLQDRETDVVRDTSDTASKSGLSDQEDEYEVIEYEVASLSETDNENLGHSSSGSEDMILAAAAAAICDNSLEKWITDCEESDNSSLDDSAISRGDFSTCAQCKSLNVNPLYRYCEKCYQDRKRFFPPRPRGNRKLRKTKKAAEPPVKLDTLRSCLSGLSQDSGVGSSQECPPLDLDRIVVPDEHLRPELLSTVNTEDILNVEVSPSQMEQLLSTPSTSTAVEVEVLPSQLERLLSTPSTSTAVEVEVPPSQLERLLSTPSQLERLLSTPSQLERLLSTPSTSTAVEEASQDVFVVELGTVIDSLWVENYTKYAEETIENARQLRESFALVNENTLKTTALREELRVEAIKLQEMQTNIKKKFKTK